MSSVPFVSVIVTTYNRPEMLVEALASVARQTWRNFEVIVVNDAGEDVAATVARFTSLSISYVQHDRNKGLAAARNTGISHARGAYLIFLDDDDIFYPHHLESLITEAMAHPEAGLVYSDSLEAHQRPAGNGWVVEKRLLRSSFEYHRLRLMMNNLVAVQGMLVRRQVFDRIGYFDERLPVYEDWELWLRASKFFKFHHLRKITSEHRLRASIDRMSFRERNRFIPYRFRLWKRHTFLPTTILVACVYFSWRLIRKIVVPAALREAAMLVTDVPGPERVSAERPACAEP